MAVIVAERTPSSISAISPKWSPGPRLARSLPATETAASPGLDQEERGSVGALLHDRLAGDEVPLLEQERDLLHLVRAEVGEERHALQRGDGGAGHQAAHPALVTARHWSR